MKHYNNPSEYLEMLQRARKWRKLNGYTLNDFGLIAGCTGSNVSMFESGKANSALILSLYIMNGFNPFEEVE